MNRITAKLGIVFLLTFLMAGISQAAQNSSSISDQGSTGANRVTTQKRAKVQT